MVRGVRLYSQYTYTPHTTCTKRFLSLILTIETPVSLLRMVDIGKRVCLYAFMHILMRVRSSMMLSSTCAWLRLAGGVLVPGPGAAGRDSRSPPPPPATLYLTLSRSRSLSLCPTACEKMKGSVRMSSWFNRYHKKFLFRRRFKYLLWNPERSYEMKSLF